MKAWNVQKRAAVKPAAFLDRDGTLTRDRAGVYITGPGRLKLYARTARALRLLNAKGYRLIVLTNQSGIARGYLSLERAREINLRLRRMLGKKGVRLAGVYFCPHLPGDGCACRKPGGGLLREAAKDFRTDLKTSILIGDKASDMRLAKKTGLRPFFVATGQGLSQLKDHAPELKGIQVVRDVFSAAMRAPDRSRISAGRGRAAAGEKHGKQTRRKLPGGRRRLRDGRLEAPDTRS